MLKEILKFIDNYAWFALLIPTIIAIIRRNHLHKELRAVILFLLIGIIFELISRITVSVFHVKNNLPFLHLYTVLEFGAISWFYFQYLDDFIKAKFIMSIYVGFAFFAVINAFFVQSLYEFNTYPRGLECVLVVFYAILAFYKMLQSSETIESEKMPQFWITAGFLLYFAGSLFLFILSNLLMSKDIQLSLLSWQIHACLLVLMYIFLAIGLWFSKRHKSLL